MAERGYTVSEIQAMRQAIMMMLSSQGGPYFPADRSAQIEDQLRTYMAAGTSPAELQEAMYAALRGLQGG